MSDFRSSRCSDTGFTAGYPLLFVLVLGVIARASVGPAESLLNMSDNEKVCAAVYAVTLALNVLLNILFIPRFGLLGAALATATSMLFEAVALSLTVRHRLGHHHVRICCGAGGQPRSEPELMAAIPFSRNTPAVRLHR